MTPLPPTHRKKKKPNAKGAGRPEKGYVRLVLRCPDGTADALDARRTGKETPGEALARLLGVSSQATPKRFMKIPLAFVASTD